MGQSLPQELVDIIVDEVAEERDEQTRLSILASCALTSRSFSIPARKGIFRQVTLTEDAGDNTNLDVNTQPRLERFLQLITDDPFLSYTNHSRISNHIKSLKFQLSTIRTSQRRRIASSQIQKQLLLPLILDLIPNASELDLSFETSEPQNSWNFIDGLMKKKLVQFFASRPICKIQFGNITQLPLALISCPRLRSLAMHFTTFDFSNRVEHIEPLRDLSYLRIAGGPLVLDMCNPPTRYLLETGAFRKLSTLEIKWDFGIVVDGISGLLPWIKHTTFAAIPINTLIIEAKWNSFRGRNQHRHFVPSEGWRDLDDILSTNRYSNLRTLKLDLTLRCQASSEFSMHNVQERLPFLLPSLSHEKKVSIEMDILTVVQVGNEPAEILWALDYFS